MFYCDKCREKYNWEETLSRSYGPCEMCGTTAGCNDGPGGSTRPSKPTKAAPPAQLPGLAGKLVGKRKAYTAVIEAAGFGLGLAVENEPGYYPLKAYPPGSFKTWEEAGTKAAKMNAEQLGLEREDAWRIVASSMFEMGGVR